MTEEKTLGMTWGSREAGAPTLPPVAVNTRTSLWPSRWPAIAKQECIDTVEAADPAQQAEVKRLLPCQTCELNTACLNAKQKELGSLMYDREIMTSPRTSESSLFPATLLDPAKAHGESLKAHWLKPFSLEHEYAVVQAWDIAWSEKTGGDWLVYMTASVHLPSGQRRLIDIERWQAKTFPQQIQLIKDKHAAYRADLVVIEGDAAQTIWRQQVGATSDVPVVSHAAGGEKQSLTVGVPSLLILLENRKWEVPWQPGSYHHEHVRAFFEELEAFGWNDGKLEGVGEHDDTVMCFWHLNWGIRKFTTEGISETHRGLQPGKQA